jgi:4-hydroxythreonine-4-phosphate dehydrogenase
MACLLITPGEPAGIGPDVLLALAGTPRRSRWVVVADPELLRARAEQLGLAVSIERFDPAGTPAPPGALEVLPVALRAPVEPGVLNGENAPYVLETLAKATDLMLAGAADALVTGPVHKGVIADSGIAFSGHTEFFAELSGADGVLMVLVAGTLRVALVTTHLPLRAVPDAITRERLGAQLERFYGGLQQRYGIAEPRVVVLGLNPHA